MDHLPSPTQPYQPLRVKFLCRKEDDEYDHGGFDGYPTRRRVDVNRLMKGDLQDQSAHHFSNFLQQWLYFGVLEEVFKICAVPFKQSEFIIDQEVESAHTGCSRKLPVMLAANGSSTHFGFWIYQL